MSHCRTEIQHFTMDQCCINAREFAERKKRRTIAIECRIAIRARLLRNSI